LKTEAKTHGRTTLQYKEIRNEIAAQTAAINDITKEKQKQNIAQSISRSAFEFLQTQQGFASNLLGNLIPSGATGGLVGGSRGAVAGALNPQASAADGQAKSGPTAGQANSKIAIMTRIM
jgi:hypothetical protein